jgi:hypothetical protein
MLNRKHFIIVIVIIIVLFIAYIIVGRQIPIHSSNMKVGSERIFYRETSRFIQCDVAYTEVVVHEDGTYEYVYELISIGNGSCLSDLYIWDDFKSYTLYEAIEESIVSLEDFLDSDFVIKRSIITE